MALHWSSVDFMAGQEGPCLLELVRYIHLNPLRARVVEARGLLCCWTVRELGMSATAVTKRLNISQPAVSISARRGEKLARDRAITLTDR